jgi:hypothetical protein
VLKIDSGGNKSKSKTNSKYKIHNNTTNFRHEIAKGPQTTGKLAVLKQESLNELTKSTATETRTKPTTCCNPTASAAHQITTPAFARGSDRTRANFLLARGPGTPRLAFHLARGQHPPNTSLSRLRLDFLFDGPHGLISKLNDKYNTAKIGLFAYMRQILITANQPFSISYTGP